MFFPSSKLGALPKRQGGGNHVISLINLSGRLMFFINQPRCFFYAVKLLDFRAAFRQSVKTNKLKYLVYFFQYENKPSALKLTAMNELDLF
jgi:hypothetical protein